MNRLLNTIAEQVLKENLSRVYSRQISLLRSSTLINIQCTLTFTIFSSKSYRAVAGIISRNRNTQTIIKAWTTSTVVN